MTLFTISWATIDYSEPKYSSAASFGNIYATKELARKAVMDDIHEVVSESLEGYSEEELEDKFGTKDKSEIEKKKILHDDGMFIEFESSEDTHTLYCIQKYDTDFMEVGERS